MTESMMNIDAFGIKTWALNGKVHREDGPAIERPDGVFWWCRHGKLHRLDGPAHYSTFLFIKWDKIWGFKGVSYKEEEHPFNVFRKEHKLSKKYNNWPKDKKMLFKLIYGWDT